jgi:hypothetical protein
MPRQRIFIKSCPPKWQIGVIIIMIAVWLRSGRIRLGILITPFNARTSAGSCKVSLLVENGICVSVLKEIVV